ncbi:MAG: topoisomerase IV, partial [Ruminococcus sp.]|nr:topoisomerase IV [Ruminococcus sp.]
DYKGFLLFGFENGKIAKVPLESYATKTNRKKLTKAFSDKSPISDIAYSREDKEFVISASSGRMLLLHTSVLNLKTSRATQGVAVLRLKKGHRLFSIKEYEEGRFSKPSRYRTKNLPALGALPSAEDSSEQLSII